MKKVIDRVGILSGFTAGLAVTIVTSPVHAEYCYELLSAKGAIGVNSGTMAKEDLEPFITKFISINNEEFVQCKYLPSDVDQNVSVCGSRFISFSGTCIWEKGVTPKDKYTPGCWGFGPKTYMEGFRTEIVPSKTTVSCRKVSDKRYIQTEERIDENEIGVNRAPLAILYRWEKAIELKPKPIF
jgi:hypothetical protein